MPVLLEAFPQGLEAHDPDHHRLLRLAHDEWEEKANNSAIHNAWIRFVLRKTLDYAAEALVERQVIPQMLQAEVDVPAGRDRPYMADGTIFIRRGRKTVPARPEELRELVEANFAGSERWERRLIPDGGVERLDEKLILATAEAAQRLRNYSFSDATKVKSILDDLAMFRERSITQGAEVVFGIRPATQFPQVRVRVTVYAADKGGDFIDNRQFEKAAFPMLEEVFVLIRQHTPRV